MGEYTPKQHPRNTHKQSPTKNLESRVILPHEKPGKSKSDHFHPRKTPKMPTESLFGSDFLEGGKISSPKITQQPTIRLLLFLSVFSIWKFHASAKKQPKHTSLPRVTPSHLALSAKSAAQTFLRDESQQMHQH